jgi:hypothetical protein
MPEKSLTGKAGDVAGRQRAFFVRIHNVAVAVNIKKGPGSFTLTLLFFGPDAAGTGRQNSPSKQLSICG